MISWLIIRFFSGLPFCKFTYIGSLKFILLYTSFSIKIIKSNFRKMQGCKTFLINFNFEEDLVVWANVTELLSFYSRVCDKISIPFFNCYVFLFLLTRLLIVKRWNMIFWALLLKQQERIFQEQFLRNLSYGLQYLEQSKHISTIRNKQYAILRCTQVQI